MLMLMLMAKLFWKRNRKHKNKTYLPPRGDKFKEHLYVLYGCHDIM